MRARSYVAILLAAGASVVVASLVVLSLNRDGLNSDAGGLQTSVVLVIDDNPAALSPAPSASREDSDEALEASGESVDASGEPLEERTDMAALPTLAERSASPSTAPPPTSHPSTGGTLPTEQPDEAAAPAEDVTPAGAPGENAAPAEETAPSQQAEPVVDEALLTAIGEKLVSEELRMSANAGDLAAIQAFYAGRKEPALWVASEGFSTRGQAVFDELKKAEDWGLESAAFDLPKPDANLVAAQERADGEIKVGLAVLQYARFARGGRANPSDIDKDFDQKPPLPDPKIVLTDISAAAAPDAYLRSLHPKHEQFQRLQKALVEARAKPDAKPEDIQRLVVNMERWRWLPEELGPVYVWINVPEFEVHVLKDGKDIHTEKVVVGKPVYATPVFSANMETIVFNPEWTVPPTIVKEDLLPKLRKKPGLFESSTAHLEILRVQKLKVRYKDRPVDPSRIDWSRVNMKLISFVQPAGPDNALGKVKFLYPNEHAVYMHDTIKRKLFDSKIRAEGHHCPRVANPEKFAEVLLKEDKSWGPEQIKEALAKGHDNKVDLDKPIPVHTTYFTAMVDDNGTVETFADIYKLDAATAKGVLGKSGQTQAAANAQAKPKASGSVATSAP
jgi:L,D-transpeptidase YcbB